MTQTFIVDRCVLETQSRSVSQQFSVTEKLLASLCHLEIITVGQHDLETVTVGQCHLCHCLCLADSSAVSPRGSWFVSGQCHQETVTIKFYPNNSKTL